MTSAPASLPPNTSLHERMIHNEIGSDDEYSIEYYDDFEIVEEEKKTEDDDGQPKEHLYNKSMTSVSDETIEDDDDDDEYTYEEYQEVYPPKAPPIKVPSSPTAAESENEKLKWALRDVIQRVQDGKAQAAQAEANFKKQIQELMQLQSDIMREEAERSALDEQSGTGRSHSRKIAGNLSGMVSNLMVPSKQRAKAANSAGLSELSKQLRILQAKNESQNVEINRLERQLRILADLQGISVGDLRRALEDACASEAFGELQNHVSKLKYELEAAILAKQKELRQDAAAPNIANLELRVGELEEVEEKQMTEIRDLYENLRQEKAQSTRIELENEKLKFALRDVIRRVQEEKEQLAQAEANFKEKIQELRQLQSNIMREESERSTCDVLSERVGNLSGMVSPEMAADYERMVRLLKKKDDELTKIQAKLHANEIRQAEKLEDSEDRSRQLRMDKKVEADKLALTVKELEDADGQNGLRLAQYKARFSVQDERLVDMGQQLDSLYTAFDLVNEEFNSEMDQRAGMRNNLQDADAESARQTKKKEDLISTVAPVAPTTPVTYREPYSITPFSNKEESLGDDQTPRTPQSTSSHSTITNDLNNETPIAYATAQAFHPTPERTPSTWELLLDRDNQNRSEVTGGSDRQVDDQLICGPLIVKCNGMLRKWKTKQARIILRGEGYQWEIGDKRSFHLQFGVSKVEFHPNYPLSFVVYLNPSSPHAPTIHAAAPNEHDYHRWMAALSKATTGEKYEGGEGSDATQALPPSSLYHPKPPPSPSNNNSSPLSNQKLPPTTRNASQLRPLPSSSISEESEDDDLKRVLELSKHEM